MTDEVSIPTNCLLTSHAGGYTINVDGGIDATNKFNNTTSTVHSLIKPRDVQVLDGEAVIIEEAIQKERFWEGHAAISTLCRYCPNHFINGGDNGVTCHPNPQKGHLQVVVEA